MADLKEIESHKTFGGWVRRFSHTSKVCNCTMNFYVFVPAQAEHQKVPVSTTIIKDIFQIFNTIICVSDLVFPQRTYIYRRKFHN